VPGHDPALPVANEDLCTTPNLCTTDEPVPGKTGAVTAKALTLQKGRPPPGGEEARVVVYQPRGVGLMHPRLSRVLLTIHMTGSCSARAFEVARKAFSRVAFCRGAIASNRGAFDRRFCGQRRFRSLDPPMLGR
jgi:hypothetical protein